VASILVHGGPDVLSAGASGGAMGLVGCAAAFRFGRTDDPARARQLVGLLLVVGATIFVGIVEEGIDNGAHLGGLLVGFGLGLVLARISPLPDALCRTAAAVLVLAVVASVGWMAADLPSWRTAVPFEGAGFSLPRPGRFAVEEVDGSFVFSRPPLGEFRVVPVASGVDPVEVARGRLRDAEAEARAELQNVPGAQVRSRRGDGGATHAGTVVARRPGGGNRLDLYVLRDPGTGRAALLEFTLPAGDRVAARRIREPVLTGFRFR
jgi:hypothetical protein